MKANEVDKYSDEKHLRVNVPKTKYLNMSNSNELQRDTIVVNSKLSIEAVDDSKGYNWLGFWLMHSNDVQLLIKFNLKKKMFNVVKYYEWLEMHADTPISITIDVLYSCLFLSLLYSCECWGDVLSIKEDLLLIERKALKAILVVKSGTTNILLYVEICRPDLISLIKDRQFNFIQKIFNTNRENAIVKAIYELYKRLITVREEDTFMMYYGNLESKNGIKDLKQKRDELLNSPQSMCTRYKSLIGIPDSNIFLYSALANDDNRKIITRWRLSSHPLYIETGRHNRPKIPRERRLCMVCNTVEDEYHALYICRAHQFIRNKYSNLLNSQTSVGNLLNPQSIEMIKNVARYLEEIENNMKILGMIK